jgi:hypothetical protein
MAPNTGPVNDDQAHSPELTDAPGLRQASGESVVAAPTGSSGSSRKWRWLVLWVVACGTVAVVGLTAWRLGMSASMGSTKDIELITPAPQTAGGLAQDKLIESEPGYEGRVNGVREFYANAFHLPPAGSDVAIYLGQFGSGAPNNSDLVIYLGYNLREHDDTSMTIRHALSGLGAKLVNAIEVPVTGGPGDTSYDCLTGDGSAGIGTSGQFTACGWATDRTLAIFLRVAPDPAAKQLISVMKKMRPDLIHG